MYKQREVYRHNAPALFGLTHIQQLPESGKLSALWLELEAESVPGSTVANPNWRIQDFISLVEVIGNGATVIKSYTGKELQYLYYKHHCKVPPHFWRNIAANTQMDYFPILFGRTIWDPTYGLDLSQWDTVELKVTNTATAAFYTGFFRLSIFLDWVRDSAGSFSGYVRSEEWRTWITVQDQWTYLILPTEYPISMVALRALPLTNLGCSLTGYGNLMDQIEFKMGGGVLNLFVGSLGQLNLWNYMEEYGEVFTSGEVSRTALNGVDVGVGRMFGWSGIQRDFAGATSAGHETMAGVVSNNTLAFGEGVVKDTFNFLVRGMGFQNMEWLWHSEDLSPETLLDPKVVGDVLLNIHARNIANITGGTSAVVLERLVSR